MPATTGHILTNIDRTYETQDSKLIALLEGAIQQAESDKKTDLDAWAHEVWDVFIRDADAVHYADHIPGTVGRIFRQNYGTLMKRGRKPVDRFVALTPKQMALLDAGAVDFSTVVRYKRVGDKIVFTAQTPVIRALRRSLNDPKLDAKAKQSLRALLSRVPDAKPVS